MSFRWTDTSFSPLCLGNTQTKPTHNLIPGVEGHTHLRSSLCSFKLLIIGANVLLPPSHLPEQCSSWLSLKDFSIVDPTRLILDDLWVVPGRDQVDKRRTVALSLRYW